MKNKSTKGSGNRHDKHTKQISVSTDKETPIWCFNNVDNDGQFRVSRETINADLMMDKLLSLSKMTWAGIK